MLELASKDKATQEFIDTLGVVLWTKVYDKDLPKVFVKFLSDSMDVAKRYSFVRLWKVPKDITEYYVSLGDMLYSKRDSFNKDKLFSREELSFIKDLSDRKSVV